MTVSATEAIAHFAAGQEAREAGDYAEAIRCFALALSFDPGSVLILDRIEACLAELRRLLPGE